MFNQLANSVEAFTSDLLDPLRSNEKLRERFGISVLDNIIDDAIDLDQKKVFFDCRNTKACLVGQKVEISIAEILKILILKMLIWVTLVTINVCRAMHRFQLIS